MKIRFDILDINPAIDIRTYDKVFITTILLFSLLFGFWKLNDEPLSDWDEARQGVNAFEMIRKKDYINYYYANDQLDTWNAKPPLMIWSIVASYKLFGYNEFALRFPAVISILFFFIFAYKIIRLYRDPIFASLVCISLMGCKAVFWWHIGRTGDFDAMLLAFLTISTYYTLLYLDFNKKYAIITAGFFLGLAFYTKGIPAFFLLPGIAIYATLKNKLYSLLKDPKLYISILLFLTIVGSWFLLLGLYGKSFETDKSYGGSKNALETMLFYDTMQRFSSKEFDPHDNGPTLEFFFMTIDVRLSEWSYLFYPACACGLYLLFLHRKKMKEFILSDSNNLVLFSLCLCISLGIVLTLARNKNDWYMAPLFLFVNIITFTGIFYVYKKHQWISYSLLCLVAFTLVKHFKQIDHCAVVNIDFMNQNKTMLKSTEKIYIVNPPQSIYLYLKWVNPNVYITDNEASQTNIRSQNILLIKRANDFKQSSNWVIKPL